MTLGTMEDAFFTLSSAGVTGSERRDDSVPVSPVCAPTLKFIDFFKTVVRRRRWNWPTAALRLPREGSNGRT